MNQVLRRRLLAVVAILCSIMAVGWGWSEYTRSRRLLAAAEVEMAACRQAAAALQGLPQGSDGIAAGDLAEDQLLQRIPDAARAVGLSTEQVIRSIRPQTSSRAGESKTVEVGLEGLTLEQLVRYLHHLRANNPQFQITAFTLSEPKGLGSEALWRVEPLVLTYRVSKPTGRDHP